MGVDVEGNVKWFNATKGFGFVPAIVLKQEKTGHEDRLCTGPRTIDRDANGCTRSIPLNVRTIKQVCARSNSKIGVGGMDRKSCEARNL